MVHTMVFETKSLHLFSDRLTVDINDLTGGQMTYSPLGCISLGVRYHLHLYFYFAFVRKSSKEERDFV